MATTKPVASDPRKLRERKAITQKFISDKWGVELAGYEEAKQHSKESDKLKANLGRT
jgi:hypothetical protein